MVIHATMPATLGQDYQFVEVLRAVVDQGLFFKVSGTYTAAARL
jgi:hypothetical protein